MSLINNMLRDLDQRRAEMPIHQTLEVRAIRKGPPRYGRKGGWAGFALLALMALASVAYGINEARITPTVAATVAAKVVEPPQPPPFTLKSLRFSGGQEAALPLPEAVSLRESRQLVMAPPVATPLAAITEVGELVRAGRRPKAEKLLQQSLRRNPMDQHSRLLLARLLWDRNQQEKAVTLLTKGLSNSQGSELARLLAHFRLQQQRPKEALTILEQAAARLGWENRLQVAQDPELASFMAALHQQLGAHSESIRWYEALLNHDPDASSYWLAMAISLEAITAHTEAKQAFRRALDTGRLTTALEEYAQSRVVALVR